MVLKYKSKIIYYISLSFILLMIFRNSWLPYGVKFLPGKEIYLVVFILSLLFIFLFDINQFLNQDFIFHFNYNAILLLLIFFFGVSTLLFNIQEITENNYYRFRFLTHIFYFILYFIVFPKFLFQNPSYFKKFTFFITLLGTFVAITALLLLILGLNPPGTYEYYAISIVWHPNYTAFIFTVSIFSTLYIFFKNDHSVFIKVLLILSFVFQNIALILTFCRAAIIGISIGYILFLFIRYKWKLILLTPLIPIVFSLIFQKIFTAKGTGSTLSRLLLIFPAIQMITDSTSRLLWGYGITNSFKSFNLYRENMGILENVNNPHNAYLSAIIEFGIIFTSILIIFLLYIFYALLKKSLSIKNTNEKLFYSYILSSLLALLVHSIFDSQILMPEFFCIQFFLIYFGIAHYYVLEKRKYIGITTLWSVK